MRRLLADAAWLAGILVGVIVLIPFYAIRAALTADVDELELRLLMGCLLGSFLSAAIEIWSFAHPHIVAVVR